MKNNKKTIIIIAIVVAVVAYLVWKNRKGSDDPGETTSTSSGMSVKSILSSIGASATVKSYVNNIVAKINKNAVWKQKILDQAAAEDITFNQAAVLNALWLMYDNKDEAGNHKLSWSEFDKLCNKVRDL